MKKIATIILFVFFAGQISAQIKIRYGITGGLNVSSAILPELKLNNLNNIIHGDDVVKGEAQLADFVNLYKVGLFYKIDGDVGTLRFDLDYTSTNIHKDIKTFFGNIEALNIDLTYLDFNVVYNLNIGRNFYFSAGYVPSLLLDHNGNLDVNGFDHKALTGFGYRFANGATVDLNALIGLSEIIDGSYIHNVMIPISVSIPLNGLIK